MLLSELSLGDVIVTEDGWAFVCVRCSSCPSGKAVADGHFTEDVATAHRHPCFKNWRFVSEDEIAPVVGLERMEALWKVFEAAR